MQKEGKAPTLGPVLHSPSNRLDASQQRSLCFYPLNPTMTPPSPSPSPFISKPLRTTTPLMQFYNYNISRKLGQNSKRVAKFEPHGAEFPVTKTSGRQIPLVALAATNSELDTGVFQSSPDKLEAIEEDIEKVIYRCRFMTLLAVFGSLTGSFLCFIKGCSYIITSFMEYFVDRGKVIFLLVEAIDVYLLGTVMLVFGMGLYELFVSNLDIAKSQSKEEVRSRSNLFGLFALKERPRWLEIKSVSEMKTKLGHVIVMLLLIGFFEKCKKAAIYSPVDLLCFSASVFLSSSCLFLLSKLNDS
ncbi:PREDICTED: uncharacterized protein LOC18606923 [Theobroma cacao]|uniref:Uncharacterized protein LOC18606923 n=1 Tax=Theobroma cacao TaxID=3641 RepID=A0AB32VI31_THECC|nr:PREDICTED: uncharacterized protein LOC18606923 [Theobroma cacao]